LRSTGLHPTLGAQVPVRLLLRHPGRPADYLVTLHEWHPDGSAYPGLPEDLTAASQRRADRITLEVVAHAAEFAVRRSPPYGHDAYCLDLRAWFGADQEATGGSAVHPQS
jgi:hypothetical protein